MTAINLRDHEVRRLLDVGKVLVIRPVKPQPDGENLEILSRCYGGTTDYQSIFHDLTAGDMGYEPTTLKCPCGYYHSEWWGRETWMRINNPKNVYDKVWEYIDYYYYRASVSEQFLSEWKHWRSPVTMPRWASRLSGVVGNTRVMRVQDVTDDDVLLAGLGKVAWMPSEIIGALKRAWNARYPSMPYESCPWVWLTEIERKA